MPTSSFDKQFVIADKESSDKFLEALKCPRVIAISVVNPCKLAERKKAEFLSVLRGLAKDEAIKNPQT